MVALKFDSLPGPKGENAKSRAVPITSGLEFTNFHYYSKVKFRPPEFPGLKVGVASGKKAIFNNNGARRRRRSK